MCLNFPESYSESTLVVGPVPQEQCALAVEKTVFNFSDVEEAVFVPDHGVVVTVVIGSDLINGGSGSRHAVESVHSIYCWIGQ